ncbi:DUF1616 domain-containing protein [Haladaptatus sp. DFWS20]|uniref:DUF1616 domain-containing protein n=1 Tax=Haladaptatus sp. DFWS20 TaxID=3403467 RepID=UPI003EBCFBB5
MPPDSDLWLLIPRPVRRFPADLTAVVISTVLTFATLSIPVLSGSPLRNLLGIAFVLFIPGYVLIAAFFPEKRIEEVKTRSVNDERDTILPRPGDCIDGVERVVLSIGTSIVIVTVTGLMLNFTPWGIRARPLLFCLGGLTLFATFSAARRRWELPANERFVVPYRDWAATARTELFEHDSRAGLLLNVFLVLSVLLAVGSVAYAVTEPDQSGSFTEFYLLNKNETGTLVADDYPTNFTEGESKSMYVGINNHEQRPMDYTVVVRMERVENDTTQVAEAQELHRFHASLGANGTWRTEHDITPRMTGNRLRLHYLLFKGDAPATPTENKAYRELHLWVNVSARGR